MQSKYNREHIGHFDIEVNASGNSKVAHSKEVLVKLKRGSPVGSTELAVVSRNVDGALRSVPVESCRETKSGSVVLKFPS